MSSTRPYSASWLRWLLAFLGGSVTLLVLRLWRGFFWSHAIIVGLAVAALVYSAWRTWERVAGNRA